MATGSIRKSGGSRKRAVKTNYSGIFKKDKFYFSKYMNKEIK